MLEAPDRPFRTVRVVMPNCGSPLKGRRVCFISANFLFKAGCFLTISSRVMLGYCFNSSPRLRSGYLASTSSRVMPRERFPTSRGRGILGPAKSSLKAPLPQRANRMRTRNRPARTFHFHPGVAGAEGGAGLTLKGLVDGCGLRRVGIGCRAFWEWIAVILHMAQQRL